MKKVTLGLFLVCLSIMLTFFSYGQVYAEQISIDTIYPENIVDYIDLTNISYFDINDEYIAYTLDNSSVTLFKKDSREYISFSGFNGISKIKLTNNTLIVADSIRIKAFKDFDTNKTTTINEISLENIKAIDIYTDNNYIYIATIDRTTFKLFRYDLSLNSITNNPIQTITPSIINFDNAFMMAINSRCAYIVYKKLPAGEKYTTGLCKISLTSTTNNIQILDTFQANARVIDTFIYENTEYISTFTNEILYLLSSENEPLANINISNTGDLSTSSFPIFEVSEIQFYNNKLYIADTEYKTIQSVSIGQDNDTFTLNSDGIIIGSNSFDYGRFNNASNIYIQGDTYLISDTDNNRLHILRDNKSYFVTIPSTTTAPHSITIDSNQNIYVSVIADGKNQILKYEFNNLIYTLSQTITKFNNADLGYISSMQSINGDTIFILDSTNNNILYYYENTINKLENINLSSIILNNSSEIDYLRKLNYLVIKSGNQIFVITTDGTVISSITIPNLSEITVDASNIYAITNSEIITLAIENNSLNKLSSINFDKSDYSKFCYDIIARRMIAFCNSRSCLTSFQLNTDITPFELSDISENNSLNTSSTLIPLSISNGLIYDYPYELGNIYNTDNSIKKCVAIDEYASYYRVLFNYNDHLQCGFIKKNITTKVDYTYKPINVITTNQVIAIYKYPTLLTYNGERIITSTLPINYNLTLMYEYPISLDGRTFYLYQSGDDIGFIFNADVVLSDNKTIKNLNTENASIHLIGKENTYLYSEDLNTKLKTLKESDRIYVEKYDKKEKYTRVIIKDSNLNTLSGYVLTEDIKMDKLDNSKVILIIVIIVTLLLLALIIVSYIVIKKKNK